MPRFQLTPSQRATVSIVPNTGALRHFNSRPHRGRQNHVRLLPYPHIFQLTPSQRATAGRHAGRKQTPHFNSRPHRGRRIPPMWFLEKSNFNSRPHRGRRFLRFQFCIRIISTHALTEGDLSVATFGRSQPYFNSRPHRGRQVSGCAVNANRNFNSRPHRGRRLSCGGTNLRRIFQLTPSQRATRASCRFTAFRAYSNSRPHRGRHNHSL